MRRILSFAWVLFISTILAALGLYLSGWLYYFILALEGVYYAPAHRLASYTAEFWLIILVTPVGTWGYVWLLRASVKYMRRVLRSGKIFP